MDMHEYPWTCSKSSFNSSSASSLGVAATGSGNDLVGIAGTGSGKTLAYVLPMLVHIHAQSGLMPGEGPMGLVLVPNRELCDQVTRQVNEFSGDAGIVCQSVFGGIARGEQGSNDVGLRGDITVATPGLLLNLLEMGKTNLRRATFVVLILSRAQSGKGMSLKSSTGCGTSHPSASRIKIALSKRIRSDWAYVRSATQGWMLELQKSFFTGTRFNPCHSIFSS